MINKTMRQNIEVAMGVAEIMELNPRITKESEVFPYAYNQVATDIKTNSESVNWDDILLLDFQDRKSNVEFSETRSITIDEEAYQIVLESYCQRPKIRRVQFAYLTRLVLLYTRKKLRDVKGLEIQAEPEIIVEKINGIPLIRQFLDLIENESKTAQKKLLKIKEIFEEEE